MNFRLVGPALLAMMVAALAGCGGGGGGTAAQAPPTTPGGTLTGITVNSPPVVTFVVNDAGGKPVSGLKLFDADPACGGSNVAFAIAKYDGANWQSLISRQRFETSGPGALAVVEGATDPTPATTTSAGVGTLEEANGVYTYHFATDVTTPLLLANAVNYVSLGKVANNGSVAVKDGQTIHRVALRLCYVDPVTQETVKVNPTMDFSLGANGQGVPFRDAQGNLKPAIQVVDRASCNECHQNFALHDNDLGNDPTRPDHGIYVDPQVCVMCHNPGSTDYATGRPIDFKLMVHKFHMGKRLTQDYAVGAAVARNDAGGVITGVLYPQDQRNCVKCHDGLPSAAHKTTEGNNWVTKPSKNACFACHDDYKVAGSKWQNFHAGYAGFSGFNLANPDTMSDAICQTCHNVLGQVAQTAAQEHKVQEWVRGENYQFNILGITRADNKLTVEFSVSNPKTGADYDLLDSQYQYTVTAGATTTKTFRFGDLNMLFGWNTTDYSNDGATGRAWNSSCTVAPTVSPSCDTTTGLPPVAAEAAITRGQPVSLSVMFDPTVRRVGTSNHFKLTSTTLPEVARTGSVAVAFQGFVSEQKDASTSWHVQVKNLVEYFAMNGTALARRQVVSADRCNACHGRNLAFTDVGTFKPVPVGNDGIHDGGQTDPEVCVICHNGNLDATSVLGDRADSGHFKRMVHMLHKAQGANYPVMPSTLVTTGNLAGTGTYTGIMNCNICHVNDSYKKDLGLLGSSTIINATDPSRPSLNSVISPKAAACSSCHTDANPGNPVMKSHMVGVGGAAFGSVTQAGISAGQVFEACDGCHQSGAIKPVDSAHLGVTN